MSAGDPFSPTRPRVTTLDLYNLADTFVRAGMDLFGRPLSLAADSLRRGFSLCEQGLLGQDPVQQTAQALALEYTNFVVGLATTIPYALENMASRIDNPPTALISQAYLAPIGTAPAEHGRQIIVPDESGGPSWPLALPARIIDSSQGWAGWFTPVETATAFLAAAAADGRIQSQIPAGFAPLDCGGGRTLVALQGTDYRVSDLGAYREIALILWLTPAGTPIPQPGMFFVAMLVSDPRSVGAARAIWGFEKSFFGDLAVDYTASRATFYTGDGSDDNFALALPRFGGGRSTQIPVQMFTAAPDDPNPPRRARSSFRRNGEQEGLQFGGQVTLRLGTRPPGAAHEPPYPSASCFCSDGGVCLCDQIRALLPPDAGRPAANGWTEWMSGSLDEPEYF